MKEDEMSRFKRACSGVGLALASLISLVGGAAADPVEDFYKGKTLRVIIGYAAGGGYDIYGRIFAEFFSRFLPGHPTIVAQNMPGAGSFLAAKYIYNVAPKDGTVFACLAQTLPLDAAMQGQQPDLDVLKMPYLGRLATNIDLGLGLPDAWFKDFSDARKKEIVVGATGGSSPGFLLPTALNKYAGAKFKVIVGYSGSADAMLAVERHEVDIVGSIGIPATMARNPSWIRERKAPILYQSALTRHPLLPHVPALPELGETEDGKGVLTAIAVSSEIGRSIITTPGVPPERLAALRKAFQAMVQDPEFLDFASKREITVEPTKGEDLDQITRDTLATPKRVLDLTAELLKAQN
jgi:tripartite-type tricarboxylate transporter receptor subunit TctC